MMISHSGAPDGMGSWSWIVRSKATAQGNSSFMGCKPRIDRAIVNNGGDTQ